jgi:hypothetical protein
MKDREKVWLGEQERKYSCGPASLKYALCLLGHSPREGEIRQLARTTWRGTQTKPLIRAASRFGVTAKVRHFMDDEWSQARDWLHAELNADRPVILDVDGFQHYVVAVQVLDGKVIIIDPEGGPMDGSAYARIIPCNDKKLRSWWLSGEEEGEPEAFRGTTLHGEPVGPRLRFSAETVRRYRAGRPWILDEYLIDCMEIAEAAKDAPGEKTTLASMIRELGAWLVVRVNHWHGTGPGQVSMLKAHIEDLAFAADAMALEVPSGATAQISADVATILMAMLLSP